jgi:membrane carboxypeptidase/penicillin-binding protein PbpC
MKYLSAIFALLIMTINASAEVLSSNELHNCAINTDGVIVCWGKKTTPPNDTGFGQISAGKSHNCALKEEDGTMVCWGLGKAGKAQEGQFSKISAAKTHNCAIKFDGSVICWGIDGGTKKTEPPSDKLFSQISAGYNHSCGITTSNTILCWGKGRNGETTAPSGTYSQVSAGDQFTCGIKTDGTLACWGKDDKDQTSAPSGQFSKVSVGKNHACAINKADNSIICWGKNNSDKTTAPNGIFREISVGSDHSCAVKMDRSVECWGSNSFKRVEPIADGLIVREPPIPCNDIYTLTTNATGGKIVRSAAEPYKCKTKVTLEAIADETYSFLRWEVNGVISGFENKVTITMNKKQTVTAVFVKNACKINIDPTLKNGSISPNKTIFECNKEVILTAKPERCYTFTDWNGACSGNDPSCTLMMDTDKTISANFVKSDLSLKLIAENGQITSAPAKSSYACDQKVTLTAKPDTGYIFVRWEGDITGSTNTVRVKMDSNKEVKAIFEAIPVKLSVSSSGNGTVSGKPTTTLYNQEVTLTAEAQSCNKFKQWNGACSGKMPTCIITLNGNTNVIAEFEPETFSLTTNAINGKVIRNPDNEIYNCGSTVRLTAVANEGFKFFEWKGDASGSGANINIEMTKDKNVTAEFAIDGILNISPAISIFYTKEKAELTALDGVAPYTWSSTGGQLPINTGDKVHFSANAPGSYQVTVTDNTGITATATVEVTAQLSLSPQYVPDLPVNGKQTFSITGGKPPYLVTTSLGDSESINSDSYNFTAPENPGTVTLTVKDAIAGELSAQINIVKESKIIVTPSGTLENPLILSLGEDIRLTVKGGVPNYNWTVTAGNLSSTQGKTVTYIAPKASGEQTITVTDKKGNKVEVPVKVINELVCSPHLTTMILGDKSPITFRAMGGAEPYRWEVESGAIDPEGAEVSYQPPAQEGEFNVICKDAQDKSVSPLVRVVKGLNISPAEKSLAIGESANLQISGGQAPFTWVAECGDLTSTSGTLVGYTAPQRNGLCEVTVTDALSQAAKTRIQVIGNLIITPIKTVAAIGETVKISAARGTDPYTWSDGKIGRIWTGKFNQVSRHEVIVTDAAGDTGLAIVDVIPNNLGLTPELAFLSRNEIQNITVSGGTSPYAWNAEAGTLSSTKGTRVAYIAPDQPGSYNITVRDGRDVQGKVKVIVKADVIELKSNKSRNDMGSINSNIIVDGVERHEKEILVDAASNIEASFSLEMPNDGQDYKVYGAIVWVGLEEQPVILFKTSTQPKLVRFDPNQEFPIYKTAAAGETVVVKDVYNGPLSKYSGHQLVFYVGYAAVGTDVLKGLLFNATQPYSVLVK